MLDWLGWLNGWVKSLNWVVWLVGICLGLLYLLLLDARARSAREKRQKGWETQENWEDLARRAESARRTETDRK